MNIYSKLLPTKITNQYSGNKIALYFFVAIVSITIVRSLIHIFSFDGGSQSIAGFPLDNFPQEAGSIIILMFCLWGISQLIIGIIYLIVLIRYKSLLPLMYVLLFIEYTSRLLAGFLKHASSTHLVPGVVGDYIMIPLTLLMFILSMRTVKN